MFCKLSNLEETKVVKNGEILQQISFYGNFLHR